MGVLNHYRTSEVLVEVVYIFTHSGGKTNQKVKCLVIITEIKLLIKINAAPTGS